MGYNQVVHLAALCGLFLFYSLIGLQHLADCYLALASVHLPYLAVDGNGVTSHHFVYRCLDFNDFPLGVVLISTTAIKAQCFPDDFGLIHVTHPRLSFVTWL